MVFAALAVQGQKDVAKPELGNKHQCQHCGTKFFDLNRDPVTCPKCGTVQQNISVKAAAARPAPADEDVEIDPAAPVLVPIEEADVIDDKAAVVTDEIEIEDDAAEETFLEEEEEDEDDVSGLIDGEIEDDEEA
jgi:uncharacterized protein (TIGR02300 family)